MVCGIGVAAGGVLEHRGWRWSNMGMYIGNQMVEGSIHGGGESTYFRLCGFRLFAPDGRVQIDHIPPGGTDAVHLRAFNNRWILQSIVMIVNVIDDEGNLFENTHHTKPPYSNMIYVHFGKSSACLP
jgi:hypothetical protein